jgi:hypothetical protein
LLHLERPTTKSVTYNSWKEKPSICIEDEIDICCMYLPFFDDEEPFNVFTIKS